MKTVKIVIWSLMILLTGSVMAQSSSPTKGKDFWLGFMRNHEVMAGESLDLFIVSDQNTSGTVTIPGQSWSTSFNVTANGMTTVTVPNVNGEVNAAQGIEAKGIHIETQDTVAVFAINFNPYSSDATKVLPTPTLGTEYIVAAYAGFTPWDSELLIVATEDDTEVEIIPSVNTVNGSSAGVPIIVSLSAGQCYQLTAGAGLDLTGTIVRATTVSGSCRPFAVFSGASCANVPTNCSTCDHLFEQNLPVESWGTEYYVTPYIYQVNPDWGIPTANYTYRVMAKENNTAVIIDGGASIILDAGEFQEFQYQTGAHCVNANAPITVIQYMEGVSCGGNGDPSMSILDDASKKINDITFSTVNSSIITSHYLNVIVETDNISDVYFDGAPIASNLFQNFPNCSSHMYAAFSISEGTHSLAAPDGVTGYVYGNGESESYAYSVGSFKPTPPIEFDQAECANGSVTISVEPSYFNPVWYNYQDMETPIYTGYDYQLAAPVSSAIYVAVANENASGCEQEFFYSIEDVNPPVFTVDPPFESICQHESVQLQVSPQTTAATYNYVWSPSITLNDATIANPIASPMVSTTYTVTVSTPTGCASSSQNVTINVSPGNITSFDLVVDETFICEGESVQIDATTETVVWSDNFDPNISLGDWDDINNGASSATCGSVSGSALYFTGTGERSATTNAIDVSMGGTIFFSIKIANGIAPCDNAEPGDNVELRYSTDGVTFPAGNTIMIFNESAYPDFTDLAIEIPAGALTNSTKFRWIQVGAWAGNQDNWCIDEVYIATNSQGNFTYDWSPSSTLDLTDVLHPVGSPDVTTNYVLNITDIWSGCIYTDSVLVNVGLLFNLDVSPDAAICDGDPMVLHATPDVPGNYTYEWGPNDGSLSGLYFPEPSANPDVNTLYTVTVTSEEGCIETAEIQIDKSPITAMSITFNDVPVCAGDVVNATAAGMGTGAGFGFDWICTEPVAPIGNGVSVNITPESSTAVTLNMEHTASGCVYSDSFDITVLPTPVVTVTEDEISGCSVVGEAVEASTDFVGALSWSWLPANMVADPASPMTSLILDQSGTITISAENAAGCAGSATITIDMQTEETDLGPDINLCEGDDIEVATGWANDHLFAWDHGPTTNSVVVSEAGTYHVVVTSPAGCVSEDEIVVTVNPYPIVDLGPDQVACEGEVVNLIAGELGLNYEWSTGSQATNININQTGDYSVSVDNGFCESTDMVYVLFNPLPENPFTPSEMDFCFTLPPYVAKLDAKNEGCTYEWDDGTTGQVYNATVPGIYYVKISTDLGCEARYQMFIFEECPGAIWAPNAFTPDGDGINDVWLVEGVNVASYYLVMWNRWGEQMFETHSLDRPWLGQRRDGDEYVEAGVYHYRILFTIDEGGGKISEEKEINGQVTLVR